MILFWVLIICFAMGMLGISGTLLVGVIAISYIATHPRRERTAQTPEIFGARFEDVEFVARDGVTLSSWFVPANVTNPLGVLILCHGMNSQREAMLDWAEALWKQGFALLMFDFRGTGESEGKYCSGGYYERADLHGATDYLCTRTDTANLPIGVLGFSMGGATAILTASENPSLRAVAVHGAYATMDRAMLQRCRRHFKWLARPAKFAMLLTGKMTGWFRVPPSSIAPVEVVSLIAPRPLLILHGEEDPIVHWRDAHDLCVAAGSSAEYHPLPGSGHRNIAPEILTSVQEQVGEFFRKSLAPSANS